VGVKEAKMERVNVRMADPVLGPGSQRVAKVPIVISPAGLACIIELFLGPDENTKVVSNSVGFTSTGAEQLVQIPVTMPGSGGAYHVYGDISSEDYRIVGFIGTEDVIIPEGSVGPIEWE
jgi:hypothetical protein